MSSLSGSYTQNYESLHLILLVLVHLATGDLALQILSVSSTTVSLQWNCASTDNIALTWKGTADNTVETWHRKDKKVFELCQTANISQSVQAVITDLEEGVEYSLSVTQSETGLNFKTLTSGG